MKIERQFIVEKHTFNPRNERLKPFVTRINNCRVVAGYKPLTARYIATLMAHVDTDELEGFYKKLDQSKNFCALWWYYCKPKKK